MGQLAQRGLRRADAVQALVLAPLSPVGNCYVYDQRPGREPLTGPDRYKAAEARRAVGAWETAEYLRLVEPAMDATDIQLVLDRTINAGWIYCEDTTEETADGTQAR